MREKLRLEWHLLRLALRFLTCMPVTGREAGQAAESDDLRVRANKYFPVVGVMIGAMGALVFWAAHLWLPLVAALIVSLIATLFVTGAFHEDGLANAVEGMCRGSGRVQVLEMMAAPGLGLFGALAVALSIGLKLALLSEMPIVIAGLAMMVAHLMGMMAVVHVIATTPYAHSNGLQVAAPYITSDGYRFALMTSIGGLGMIAIYLGPWLPLSAVLGSIVLGQFLRSAMMRKLGGYNSDCLGAVMIMGELGAYLGVSVWL